MVAHTCNLSTQGDCESKASLSYRVSPGLKKILIQYI
jgi:hypothetical protein